MAYPKVFLEWEAATEARGKARGAKDKALSIILRQLNRRIGSLNQQQFQIQGSYPKYPATKVAATQTKPTQGGLRLPNWRVMTL